MRGTGKRLGVTNVELLITMTLIGIMVAMVSPKLKESPNMIVRIAARQLMRDVEVARNRALSLKRTTRFMMTAGTNQYVVYGDNDGDGAVTGTTAEILFAHGFGIR